MTIKLRPYDSNEERPLVWDGQLTLEVRPGRVCLVAVYPNGEPINEGILLSIDSGGLYRHTSIASSLRLPLDRHGRLVLDSEPDYPARIAELEAEVKRLTGSEAPPDKGAWRATEADQKRTGCCLVWLNGRWIAILWKATEVGDWVREQPPPPPGGGA